MKFSQWGRATYLFIFIGVSFGSFELESRDELNLHELPGSLLGVDFVDKFSLLEDAHEDNLDLAVGLLGLSKAWSGLFNYGSFGTALEVELILTHGSYFLCIKVRIWKVGEEVNDGFLAQFGLDTENFLNILSLYIPKIELGFWGFGGVWSATGVVGWAATASSQLA